MDAALADKASRLSERAAREGWSLLCYDVMELFRTVARDGADRDPADIFCMFVAKTPSMGGFLAEVVPLIVAGWRPGLEHLCAKPASGATPEYHWRDELADALGSPTEFEKKIRKLVEPSRRTSRSDLQG